MTGLPRLRERQIEMLRLAAAGGTNASIGRQLWVSEDTVKTHLSRAYKALGATDRGHAVALAVAHEVIASGLDEQGRHVVVALMDGVGPIPCPSDAAYWRHRARKEEPCPGCLAAHSAYVRGWRQRRAS